MNQVSIAIQFKKKLGDFSNEKQKEVMQVVAQLMIDETSPSLKLHKMQSRDWWTVSVDRDIRIVLQRNDNQIFVVYVDHHDAAYRWAERNKLSRHPVTGSLQIVEIPQIISQPIVVQTPSPSTPRKVKPFVETLAITRDELFGWGIPEEWLDSLLKATTQDEILDIALHLPADVAEIAMAIGEGKRPIVEPETDSTKRDLQAWHVVSGDEDLTHMLDEKWDLWAVYLHPTQRSVAEKIYSGPARVGGSAGTGKTVVLLHHAKYLLRSVADCSVLITTFSDNLAMDLAYRLGVLLVPQELERCDTRAFYDFGHDCYKKFVHRNNPPRLIDNNEVRDLILETIQTMELPKGIYPQFVCSEWEKIVDVRNLMTWESYRDTKRRNVTIRLSVQRREAIWKVFEAVYKKLEERHEISQGMMFGELATWYKENSHGRGYDYILVDEAQDLGEIELAFLVAYNTRSDGLFFAGDIGQRVCRYAFPWSQYGIDLRGKSKTLKINYRTTQEIRTFADKLVTLSQTDPDGEKHDRTQTISLLKGPQPQLKIYDSIEDEIAGVAKWLNKLKAEKNISANNIAIFVRSDDELERAYEAYKLSDYSGDPRCKITTMEKAKGLEYQVVIVMACDCNVLPSPTRLAEKDIVASLDEIYDTERNLFYVACTRARDFLLVTSGDVPSEFLLDVE